MSALVKQIEEAFERDQATGFKPVYRKEELPLSYDALTDQWLEDVLCAGHADARVIGHTIGLVDNGSTNRRKITVTYNQAGNDAGLPRKLFCKATHGLANRIILGLAGGAQCEADYYNLVRPHIAIESPEAVYAKVDGHSFNSMIILLDISDEVMEFCDHKTVMTRARAESQMRLLGHFHGAAYAKPELVENLKAFGTWPEFFEATLAFGMREGSEYGFRDAKDVIPPRLFARADEIWPATEKSIAMHNVLPKTFTHGDVHLKNWYVAGNGEMGLSDWQCCSRGHWSRDFAYTLATALTIEDRRAWEKDLLTLYLAELEANGGPKISFEDGWLWYRQQLMTALTWWTITLHPAPSMPDMQPRDVTLAFIERITTAMDDVGTLDAF
ncbi:MAG: phosphotransferase [Sphingobium sp.]